RRFRELNRPDIVLCYLQCNRALMHDVAEGPAGWHDPVAAGGELAVDDAFLVDDAAEIHLGDGFDDSRAADAGHARFGHGSSETRLMGPQVRADDLESRVQCLRFDAYAFDRSGSGTLTGTDLRSLEGRSRRTRTGEQTLAIAQHDFRVGTHIH